MRTTLAAAIAALLILAVMAGPVMAIKPIRGCPNDGFVAMSYPQFRELSLSVGVPEELMGPEHEAGWNNFDKNDDGLLCVKDLKDTPGHLGSWIFNVIDNTSNH